MSELSHQGAFRLIYKRRRTEVEQGALQSHLQHCPECRQDAEMAGLFTGHLVLKELPTRPSPQFTGTYMESAARRSRRSQIMKPIYAVGGAVALALIVLAGWFIVRANPQSQTLDSVPVETVISVAPDSQTTPDVEAAGEQLGEQLFAAVEAGDVALVEQLLDADADPNVLDDEGNALLPLAAKEGELEIVRLLLVAGADIDSTLTDTSAENETALSQAAMGGHIDILNLLIANGADLDKAETLYNRTPLHGVSWYNNAEVVKILLEAGADPNLHSTYGRGETPFHFAVRNSSHEAVQELLAGGADGDIQTDSGVTPLLMARDSEMLTMLLEGGVNPDVPDNSGNTALHRAAQANNDKFTSILIEHGADAGIENLEGQTALDLATDDKLMETLRQAGVTGGSQAETSALDEQLIDAVAAKDVASVERLLDAGASPDTIDFDGAPILKTAITMFGEQGVEIVSLLVDNGVKVNVFDRRGNALLPYAALEGKLEIVQMLLDAGIDVDGTYTDIGTNNTALSVAGYRNHKEIVELLIAHGANLNHAETGSEYTPLGYAAYQNNHEIIKILLENGADHTLRNTIDGGQTPLHGAVRMNAVEAVQALLDGGADVEALTDSGQTPLMYLMSEGYRLAMTQVAVLLLDGGADPNRQDEAGNSALHYAASRGINEAIPLLIERGASVNLENIEGQTPLDVAKDEEIAALLRGADGE